MKNFPCLLVLFLIMTSAMSLAAQDGEDYRGYPPDIRKILERGRLIVAMYHQDSPPFFFRAPSGKLVGHDVALARDLAGELGVEVEFDRSARTFDGIIDLVANHEADLAISEISITLDRAKRVGFSKPYIVLHPTLMINRLMAEDYLFPILSPLEEIRRTDQKIGVRKGTAYVGYARRIFEKAEVVEYEDWAPAMAALVEGRVIAVLRDEIGVKNYLRDNPELAIDLKVIVLEEIEDHIGLAVPPDSTHLLDWINLYLDRQQIQTGADQLLERYGDYY